MKIAIITGASSGIGRQFSLQLREQVDEVWLIARNKERLSETADAMPFKTRIFSVDLTDFSAYSEYTDALKQVDPEVSLLINCSGFGKFAAFEETSLSDNLNMIDLNCKAVVAMTEITLPYMKSGSKIINVASVAAYQPVPYINVYSATKSFVLSFSRALRRELRSKGISVTAVCPFWTKTSFFDRAIDSKNSEDLVVKKYAVKYDPQNVVKKAYKDANKRKEISIYGKYAKMQCFLTKILPHSLVMNVWIHDQKLK